MADTLIDAALYFALGDQAGGVGPSPGYAVVWITIAYAYGAVWGYCIVRPTWRPVILGFHKWAAFLVVSTAIIVSNSLSALMGLFF